MFGKISTKDIYLCELEIQKDIDVYDNHLCKWFTNSRTYYFNPPIYILAHKSYDGGEYADIINGNIYKIVLGYNVKNGEIVAKPLMPVNFNSKYISVKEAKQMLDLMTNCGNKRDQLIETLVEKFKGYAKRNPETAREIAMQMLREIDELEEDKSLSEEEKPKSRKLVK